MTKDNKFNLLFVIGTIAVAILCYAGYVYYEKNPSIPKVFTYMWGIIAFIDALCLQLTVKIVWEAICDGGKAAFSALKPECLKKKQSFQASQESQPTQDGLQEVQDPNLLYAVAMQAFSQHKYDDAVKYFMFAGTHGSSEAMNMLGVCYENGYGVPVMKDQAIKYYTIAAETGDPSAQFNLGRLYYIIGNEKYRTKSPGGVFVELVPPIEPYEEDVLAEKWFRAAAEQGNEKAQFGLGELLMSGIGVERSTQTYEEGKSWMKKSAANGFKPAIDYVEAKKL